MLRANKYQLKLFLGEPQTREEWVNKTASGGWSARILCPEGRQFAKSIVMSQTYCFGDAAAAECCFLKKKPFTPAPPTHFSKTPITQDMFAWHACWLIHSDSFRFLLHVERNRNGVPRWKTLFTNVASACPAWSSGLFVLHYMAGNRSWLGLAHVLPLPEDSQVQSSWLLHSIHTLRALSVRPPASCYFSCRGYNSPNGVRHLSLISTKLNEKMTSLLHFITRVIMIIQV